MTIIGLPELPASPMFIDDNRVMTIEWQEFFRNLFTRIGGLSTLDLNDTNNLLVSESFKTDKNLLNKIDDLEKQLNCFPEINNKLDIEDLIYYSKGY